METLSCTGAFEREQRRTYYPWLWFWLILLLPLGAAGQGSITVYSDLFKSLEGWHRLDNNVFAGVTSYEAISAYVQEFLNREKLNPSPKIRIRIPIPMQTLGNLNKVESCRPDVAHDL